MNNNKTMTNNRTTNNNKTTNILGHNDVPLKLIEVPFADFVIDVTDNRASTAYIQEIDSYTKDSLEYFGNEYVMPNDSILVPGRPRILRFKFRPLKKVKS